MVAGVGCKDLAIGRVNRGEFDGAPGLEGGKEFAGRAWIVKSKRRRTVGGEDLRQDAEIVPHRLVEDNVDVNQHRGTRQHQSGTNRAHNDEVKLALHREVTIFEHRLHFLVPLFLHDLRQTQELGADVQSLLPRGIHVDFETNLTVLQLEVDHSAIGREPRCFAHCQDLGPFESGGYGPEPFPLGGVHKEYVAVEWGLDVLNLADYKRPSLNRLPGCRLLQGVAEGVLSEYADHDRVVSGLETLGGPLHVSCKVV